MELLLGSRKRRTEAEDFARQKRLCLVPPPLPKTPSITSHHHQQQQLHLRHSKHTKQHQVDLRSLNRFHNLINDDNNNIAACLKRDMCRRFSDKYLLAQTYTYFIRCRLKPDEYTPKNFYYLLYLANDMEEDLDFKHEILPWCMGPSWRSKFVEFQREKQHIWRRMDFRLMVNVEELEAILRQGNHWIWSRERNEYHAGARRDCKRPAYEVTIQPQGPSGHSMKCPVQCRSQPTSRSLTRSAYPWSDCSDDSPNRSKNLLMSDSDSDSAYFSHNTSLV